MKSFMLSIILCFASLSAQETQKYINVNGVSELILPADQINFTVKINVIAESIEKSKKTNDINLDKLIAILKGVGIDSDDIEASPIILGKNYVNENNFERKHKGYFADVKISFILKDLSKYYELTNSLSLNNYFEIINSSYSISDYERQHKLAYEKALNAAKEKAEYMSKAIGVKLGEALEIDENNYWQSYGSPLNSVAYVNSQEDVAGKVTIRRSVRIKFAIN